MLFWLLILLHI